MDKTFRAKDKNITILDLVLNDTIINVLIDNNCLFILEKEGL